MRLSHYTTENGMIGIIRTQSLWASEFLSVNDKTEFSFGFNAISKVAFARVVAKIPSDKFKPGALDGVADAMAEAILEGFRRHVEANDGYTALYITSFAKSKTQNEDEQGVLTLWDRYTQNVGYCLQFHEQDVAALVRSERNRFPYELIEFSAVNYGIDENSPEFLRLVERLELDLMQQVMGAGHDFGWNLDLQSAILDSRWKLDMMRFCATHKDPSFVDERELRILAFPAKKAQAGFLSGGIFPKKIHRVLNKPYGNRYIALGESVTPSVVPSRLIIGPKADQDTQFLASFYPCCPAISKSNIPIR